MVLLAMLSSALLWMLDAMVTRTLASWAGQAPGQGLLCAENVLGENLRVTLCL